jgi:hypothetical protein
MRAYGFGETRVATFALLTFTALSLSRSCGVVIAKLSGHAASFRSSPTVFGDGWMPLNSHLIWQATNSYVECGDAFGLIPHEGFLLIRYRLLTPEAVYNFSTLPARASRTRDPPAWLRSPGCLILENVEKPGLSRRPMTRVRRIGRPTGVCIKLNTSKGHDGVMHGRRRGLAWSVVLGA